MSAVEKAAPTVATPAIGQSYGGGFVTGITRDPVTGKRSLHITAGAAHELVGKWGEYGVKIEGADSFTDSLANTQAMAAAGSELAAKVLALNVGGFAYWADQAAQGKPYEQQLRESCERNGIDHGLDAE